MSKKLIALVALSVSTPVLSFADTANVNVYGTMNVTAENVSATPGTNSRNRVQSNSSNFGVKGTEDLSGDMKGIFQVEMGIDGYLNKGSAVSLRNTGVGVSGGFGQVLFGLWDTPYKTATMFMEPFYGTSSGTLSNILDSMGSNATGVTTYGGSAGAYSFHRRQGNSIQYWSPNFAGIQAKVMYSADIDRSANGDPSLWSASLGYDANNLTAAVVYEIHNDFFSMGSKDTSLKAAVGYKLGDTQVGAAFSTISAKSTVAGTEITGSRPAYGASVIHHLGDLAIRLGFTMAGNGSLADVARTDAGATNGMFGLSYSFSKRTDVYAEYAKIWNQANATYSYMYNPVATLASGDDPQTFAIGLRHTF